MASNDEIRLSLIVDKQNAAQSLDAVTKQLVELRNSQTKLDKELKAGTITQEKHNLEKAKNMNIIRDLVQQQKASIKVVQAEKGSMVELSAALGRNKAAYRNLTEEQRNNENIGGKLIKVIHKQDTEIKKLDASIGNHQRHVGNYSKALGGVMGKFKELAGKAGLTMGVAGAISILADVTKKSIILFKDWEKAQSELAGVFQTNIEGVAELSTQSENLGRVTEYTATQVTELQIAYARLGFSMEEILDLTLATLNGATALQASTKDMAELTGAVIKSFGKDAKDATEIIDIMTVSTQKSALSFEKLQTGLPIVGGAAKAVGVTFTQVSSMLGVLADRGLDASSSATALRNIFIRTEKAGLTYEQAMDRIRGSQNKLSEATKLFGVRSAVAAIGLADSTDRLEEFNKELAKSAGAAAKTAETQLDNLNGSIIKLNSAWDGMLVSFGKSSGPFKDLVDGLTIMLNRMADVDGAMIASESFAAYTKGAKSAEEEIAGLTKAFNVAKKAYEDIPTGFTEEELTAARRMRAIGMGVSEEDWGVSEAQVAASVYAANEALYKKSKANFEEMQKIFETRKAEVQAKWDLNNRKLEEKNLEQLLALKKYYSGETTGVSKENAELRLKMLDERIKIENDKLIRDAEEKRKLEEKTTKESTKNYKKETEELIKAQVKRDKELKASIESLEEEEEDEMAKLDKKLEREIAAEVNAERTKQQQIQDLKDELAEETIDIEAVKADTLEEERLVELDNLKLWYEQQQRLYAGNLEAMAKLDKVYSKKKEKDEILFTKAKKDRDYQEATAAIGSAAEVFNVVAALQSQAGEDNRKFAYTGAVMSAAAAVLGTWQGYSKFGPYGTAAAVAQTAVIGVTLATQLAAINSAGKDTGGGQKTTEGIKRFRDGGFVTGPSHEQGGIKFAMGGSVAEMEGGEFISSVKTMSNPTIAPIVKELNNAGNAGKDISMGLSPEEVARLAAEVTRQIIMETIFAVPVDSVTTIQKEMEVTENQFTSK